MSPRELIAADEHLAGCETCRRRLTEAETLDAAFAFLRNDLQSLAIAKPTHLLYEQLEAYVDDKLGGADREILDFHIEECQQCAVDLYDLQAFRSEISAARGSDVIAGSGIGHTDPSAMPDKSCVASKLSGAQRKRLQFEAFDGSYVKRLRSGDFRTQEHFVAYFSELIHLKLRSRVRTPQAIEDVRQETFARVFAALKSADGIRQPDRLGAFVNSICNNVLMEYYRHSSRATSLQDEPREDFPDPGCDVLGTVADRKLEEKVREILEEMPERDRRILREVFLEERDKDAICRDFGLDRDYLRVLLHRAKQSFKSLYLKHIEGRPPGLKVTNRK